MVPDRIDVGGASVAKHYPTDLLDVSQWRRWGAVNLTMPRYRLTKGTIRLHRGVPRQIGLTAATTGTCEE